MKKQDITYQDKLNELRLDISHPHSKGQTFVLVEGESDIRLFRKFFNLENAFRDIRPKPGPESFVTRAIQPFNSNKALLAG